MYIAKLGYILITYLTKNFFPQVSSFTIPLSFLVEQARFARIYKMACGADYQIREIPITEAGPPIFFAKMNLLRCIFWLFLNIHISVFNTSQTVCKKLKIEG